MSAVTCKQCGAEVKHLYVGAMECPNHGYLTIAEVNPSAKPATAQQRNRDTGDDGGWIDPELAKSAGKGIPIEQLVNAPERKFVDDSTPAAPSPAASFLAEHFERAIMQAMGDQRDNVEIGYDNAQEILAALRSQPAAGGEVPDVMGAGSGSSPMPSTVEYLNALRRQIETVAVEAGLDPNEWLTSAQSDEKRGRNHMPLSVDEHPDWVERLALQYGARQAAALRGDKNVWQIDNWLFLIAQDHWHEIISALRVDGERQA